jgi:putative inorganic carbon (HCO3(-)) transporter
MSRTLPHVGGGGGDAGAADLLPFLWPEAGQHRSGLAGTGAYALFILLNATLFVRPAEIVPSLEGWPIYAVLATLAVVVALPTILPQLTLRALLDRPISACVVALLGAVMLSHLSSFYIWGARTAGMEFLKVVIYYLLLVGAIDRVERLRRFLGWIVALAVVATGLAVLQYHGAIDIPALAAVEQGAVDPETGDAIVVLRLVSTGIFNDPNDLCLLLIVAIAACVHGLEDRRWGSWRMLWIAPLALFAYTMTLTQSRGGFLGLLAAVVVFIWVRKGWRKGLPIAALALPVMFFLFAGRQTDLDVGEGTAQSRIQLWSEGLTLFRRAPVFGFGYGSFAEEVGLVAHNSFVHTFAELGFIGGTLFLGAFAFGFRTLKRIGGSMTRSTDADLVRLRPYLMAIVAGYAVGMISLSRAYVVPTYLILGLAAAYIEISRRHAALILPTFTPRLVSRMAVLAGGFLAGTYAFIRLFVQWG